MVIICEIIYFYWILCIIFYMFLDLIVCLDYLDLIVVGESDLEMILCRLILEKVKYVKWIIDNGILICCDICIICEFCFL